MASTKAITLAEQMERDRIIEEAVQKERGRLFGFIRKRVASEEDAEDLLQDVLYQFANSYDIVEPIRQVSSWLFTVARNRITDFYRKKKTVPFSSITRGGSDGEEDDGETRFLDSLGLDPEGDPDTALLRQTVWDTLEEALDELPPEQRDVFLWHELDGKSFQEISEVTGLSVNTLLSRKRYAVLHLRERLQTIYDELINE